MWHDLIRKNFCQIKENNFFLAIWLFIYCNWWLHLLSWRPSARMAPFAIVIPGWALGCNPSLQLAAPGRRCEQRLYIKFHLEWLKSWRAPTHTLDRQVDGKTYLGKISFVTIINIKDNLNFLDTLYCVNGNEVRHLIKCSDRPFSHILTLHWIYCVQGQTSEHIFKW